MFLTSDDLSVPASNLNDELNVPINILQGYLGKIDEDVWDAANRTPYKAMEYRINEGLGASADGNKLISDYLEAKRKFVAKQMMAERATLTASGMTKVGSEVTRIALLNSGKAIGMSGLGDWSWNPLTIVTDYVQDVLVGDESGSTAEQRESFVEWERLLAEQAAQKAAEADAARAAAASAQTEAERVALTAAAAEAERISQHSNAMSADAAIAQTEVSAPLSEVVGAAASEVGNQLSNMGIESLDLFESFGKLRAYLPWIGAGVVALYLAPYLVPSVLKTVRAVRK